MVKNVQIEVKDQLQAGNRRKVRSVGTVLGPPGPERFTGLREN